MGALSRKTPCTPSSDDSTSTWAVPALLAPGFVGNSDFRRYNPRMLAENSPDDGQPSATVARPRLLLHICCAPDATVVVERCREFFDLACFFYDPNIHPYAEYRKRADELRRVADHFGAVYYEGAYDADRWAERIRGLESELEKGRRCGPCLDLRLEETARLARQEGWPIFSTVLTVSPRKEADRVNAAGRKAAERFGLLYLDEDWKKEGGFQRSLELCRQLKIYRQDYCGCRFSRIEREIQEKLEERYESKRHLENIPTPVLLLVEIRDEEGRQLLQKREGAWELPSLASDFRGHSRGRLQRWIRRNLKMKVRLSPQPLWIETPFPNDSSGRHLHALGWEARWEGEAIPDPGTAVSENPEIAATIYRWFSDGEIKGCRLHPVTAAIITARKAR